MPADPSRSGLDSLAYWLAVGGGSGRLPKAPGTWGSLAAAIIGWWVLEISGTAVLNAMIGIGLLIGIWSAGRHARMTGAYDAGEVVIDEFVGQWIALLPVARLQVLDGGFIAVLFAFAAFRLFDIWKPWPIRAVEQRVGGGIGVMLDDIVAGIFAGALVFLVGRIL